MTVEELEGFHCWNHEVVGLSHVSDENFCFPRISRQCFSI